VRPGVGSPALERLNEASPEAAEAELAQVCGAPSWARAVAARRPFDSPAELLAAAEAAWDSLADEDWRAAIAAHPRIGEGRTARGGEASAWSRSEQARAMDAADAMRDRLADVQRRYETRFGHGFLISASGRTAEEILAICEARLTNDPAHELEIAAEEEREIGRLRLARLVSAGGGT
jgi:OHCU decarboxylase